MKKIITVLNISIPFGRALNASAHTALGMGHRVPTGKIPNIHVFMGTKEVIHKFRQAANQIYSENPESTLFADFTDTMICGTTDEQLQKTSSTPEAEIDYFAVTICADDASLTTLAPILDELTLLENYAPQINLAAQAQFDFEPAPILLDNHDPKYQKYATYKAVLVFNKKQNIDESINAMVTACLDVGKRTKLMALHLLMYVDADGGKHPNISYHAFPILTAKNLGKLETLVAETSNLEGITFRSVNAINGAVCVVCIFGEAAIFKDYTKQFSLWNREIVQSAEAKSAAI